MSQRKDKTSYSVIGGMAGSSMDGLDLCQVTFRLKADKWTFQLNDCETISYPEILYDRLANAHSFDLNKQKELDIEFGEWIATIINNFREALPKVDLLGIHGHTVIHKPEMHISWQLGNGSIIAKHTGLPTVTDFRIEDVCNGGQGAPLVPLGDFMLFSEYNICINLGGIANLSLKNDKTAWDICPCNQVLNFFAEKLGKSYDYNGSMARKGSFNQLFYDNLNTFPFFTQEPPKSLPNNYITHEMLESIEPIDGLHTYCHFIADAIQRSIHDSMNSRILITGGGAFNSFLIELIKSRLKGLSVEIPDKKIAAFKESLIFAFLGIKRFRNEINVLSSVTGASKDSSSGVIHLAE